MSKFKPPSAYNNPTPQPPLPTSETDAKPSPTNSPSPSSIPAMASVPEPSIKAVFLIDTLEGEFPLEHTGTAAMLEEIFKRYSTEGVTLHNMHGFTWYSSNFIKKITVRF